MVTSELIWQRHSHAERDATIPLGFAIASTTAAPTPPQSKNDKTIWNERGDGRCSANTFELDD